MAERTEQIKHQWALPLLERGTIVQISISRWRGCAPLDYNDLGITFVDQKSMDFMKKYFTLGQEKLLPPRVLNGVADIETRARDCLKRYSFRTTWGQFVPHSLFLEWREQNAIIREEFFIFARSLGEKYDLILEEVKQDYVLMAIEVWNRIYPDDSGSPPESFVENFCNRIIAKIPPRDEIVQSYKYDEIYLTIPLPSFIEHDIQKVNDMRREGVQKDNELEIERRTREEIAIQYKEKCNEMIDGFINDTVNYLRHYTADISTKIYLSLKEGAEDLTNVQVNKIKKMIDQVKKMNFFDDKEMMNILKELENEVYKFKGERDMVTVISNLKKISDLADEQFRPDFDPDLNQYL